MLTTYKTPNDVINALTLNEKPLNELPEHSLTKYISEISKSFRMPLAAFQTGRYRITQIYVCRYGGYQRGYNSNKIECPCHLKYEIKNGKTSLVSADWNHNHPLNREFFDAHFNSLTENEISQICEQQRHGLSPGQIRSNLNVTVNKDIFYSIRRPIISQQKKKLYTHTHRAT